MPCFRVPNGAVTKCCISTLQDDTYDEEHGRQVESLVAITLAYAAGLASAASLFASMAGKKVCVAWQRAAESSYYVNIAAAAQPYAASGRQTALRLLESTHRNLAELAAFSEKAFNRAALRAQDFQMPQILLQSGTDDVQKAGGDAEAGAAALLLKALKMVLTFVAQELLLCVFIVHEICRGAVQGLKPCPIQAS